MDESWQFVKDPALEMKLCIGVIPGFLLFWLIVYVTGVGTGFQRIVFAMPIHELGHATAGWFCGYSAIPTVWKTLVPESRGFIAPVLLLAAIGYGGFYAFQHKHLGWMLACASLVLLQLIGTFGLESKTSKMFITFSGDGLGMVLAIILMSTFYFGKSTQLYKGWLRWGFVCIGAATFIDIFPSWVQALSDVTHVAMGEQEGTHSDPYQLRYYHGWKMDDMIGTYVNIGVSLCLVQAGVYAWGLRRAKAMLDTRASTSQDSNDQTVE